MAHYIFLRNTAATSMDNSDKHRMEAVLTFLHDLGTTVPLSTLSTVEGALDKRVRIGHVTDGLDAILFVLSGIDDYVGFAGAYDPTEAAWRARRLQLEINPTNGVTTLVEGTPAERGEILSDADREAADEALSHPAPTAPAATGLPSDIAATKPADVLVAAGLDVATLETQLGIPASTTAAIALLPSFDGVDGVLARRPPWERDAIAGLLAGNSVDKVRADLGLKTPSSLAARELSSDEAVLSGMRQPAASGQFHEVDSRDMTALKKALTGDFNAWCVFLHPSQKVSVARDYNGPARVTGGAGTGKTVVALHRANRLANADPHARVLLATFTRVLAESLTSQMAKLNPDYQAAKTLGDPGIYITGIDKLVADVLKILPDTTVLEAARDVTGHDFTRPPRPVGYKASTWWSEAIELYGDGLDADLATENFLTAEYERVILAAGITDIGAYLKASRAGRGRTLTRMARKKVWRIVDAFVSRCAHEGSVPFATLATIAARALDLRHKAGEKALFTHVVIDEAQDLHAGHWRFIRALVESGKNDIFIAEDAHQRIYGARLSLAKFGIETRGRSRQLQLNYRTTRQNLGYATHILSGEEWVGSAGDDDIDSLTGYRSLRNGVVPTIERVPAPAQVHETVAEAIRHWHEATPNAHVGVLLRTKQLVESMANYLRRAGFNVESGSETTKHGNVIKSAEVAKKPLVSVRTMHSAKGMEFTHVILAGVDEASMTPRYTTHLPPHELKEWSTREKALLYVASSRARDELLVVYAGEPSKFLPDVAHSRETTPR